MEFLTRYEENPTTEVFWNVPERKQGKVNVIGGNSKNFRVCVKMAEFLDTNYPFERVNLILPDALKAELPPLDNFVFLASTESGSFADAKELAYVLGSESANLMIGDFSKNSITERAVISACYSSDLGDKPLLLTRDSVDLITRGASDELLAKDNLILFCSALQLQKLFQAIYYPKPIFLTQPLMQIVDAIHKFTLSYQVGLVTMHNGQLIIAKGGKINIVPLEKTGYSPLTLWGGECAARVLALNYYNPNNFLVASTAAMFSPSA